MYNNIFLRVDFYYNLNAIKTRSCSQNQVMLSKPGHVKTRSYSQNQVMQEQMQEQNLHTKQQ